VHVEKKISLPQNCRPTSNAGMERGGGMLFEGISAAGLASSAMFWWFYTLVATYAKAHITVENSFLVFTMTLSTQVYNL